MRHWLAAVLALAVAVASDASMAQTPPKLPGIAIPVIDASALAAARQQKRLALVIGNSRYPTAPLVKPRQDASSMAAVLTWLGYEVTLREDLGGEAMRREVDAFVDRLKATGASGLFYYSGHGVQGQAGYLLPVDLSVNADETAMQFRALPVAYVLGKMENARDGVDILIVDACRNNPYVRGLKSGGDAAVRPIPAGKRSLVAFATRLGATANEGPEDEAHSVFTHRLLAAMLVPGAKLRDVLDEVQESVRNQTRDQQIPDYSSSLGRLPVHFIPTAASPPPPLPPSRIVPVVGTYPQAKSVFRDRFLDGSGDGPDLVVVPRGRFEMGVADGEEEEENLPGVDRGHSAPRHAVHIGGPLAVGRFPVTRGEFARFASATRHQAKGCKVWNGKYWDEEADRDWRSPGFDQDDRHPVVCVSWKDAQAYVQWLSAQTGPRYRLLSEAEWEYAARAGTRTARWWGTRADEGCGKANGADQSFAGTYPGYAAANCRDGYVHTSPVDAFEANGFGLHDALGNVWNWVEDCWNDDYKEAPLDGQAWTTGVCGQRVLRGGSWSFAPRSLRSAFRVRESPNTRANALGFRVARVLVP